MKETNCYPQPPATNRKLRYRELAEGVAWCMVRLGKRGALNRSAAVPLLYSPQHPPNTGLLISALLTLWTGWFFVVGAVVCAVGWLAASLGHYVSVATVTLKVWQSNRMAPDTAKCPLHITPRSNTTLKETRLTPLIKTGYSLYDLQEVKMTHQCRTVAQRHARENL